MRQLFDAPLASVSATPMYCRPQWRDTSVGGFSHMRAAEFASLLIFLEKLGMPVDPHPFVQLLLPKIKRSKLLTGHELHILWYHKEHHKSAIEFLAPAIRRAPISTLRGDSLPSP